MNTEPELALTWMMMRSYFLNQDRFMEMTGRSKLISRHHYLDPRKEDGSETANIWFLFWDDWNKHSNLASLPLTTLWGKFKWRHD